MSQSASNQEHVLLVDELDQIIGTMEKLEAHEKGLLHRAFSVLLFNDKDEVLIQKRAVTKYHSGGLWTNTCCSHPRVDEGIIEAAHRRLQEELYLSAEMESLFSFIYRAELDNNLTEYELDHVIIGRCNSFGELNPEEVSELKFVPMDHLRMDMIMKPELYSDWFKIILLKHHFALTEYLQPKSVA
jgi:isopentenyl-diphosphate delta-isomerase